MKIATWNVDFLRKASSEEKKQKLLATLRDINADVLILTETNEAISPGEDYKFLCSDVLPDPKPYDDYKLGDHEVIIWSKYPMRQILIGEASTSVFAKVQTPRGDLNVYGTVIGIFGVVGKAAKKFSLSLKGQIEDWERILAVEENICIAGDFNVCWQGKYYPKLGKDEIATCFNELEIANLTKEVKGNIDHIAISKNFLEKSTCTKDIWNEDKALSDHFGVWVDIGSNPGS